MSTSTVSGTHSAPSRGAPSPAHHDPHGHHPGRITDRADRATGTGHDHHGHASPHATADRHGARSTTAERLAATPTTADRLGAHRSTAERLGGHPHAVPHEGVHPDRRSGSDPRPSATPLAGPAGMAARREFAGAPANPARAYEAYRHMTADHFAGPDDMRLGQLNRSVGTRNAAALERLAGNAPPDADVYGRAKTPFSTFGKLRETPGSAVGDIKDLSGMRVDVTPTRPGFADVHAAQSRAGDALGEGLVVKRDYIREPNAWGYTGRVHSTLAEADGLTHEVQVGPRDLSRFIDQKLPTTGGGTISLHDATGYKGEIHGVNLPRPLAEGYPRQMANILEVNARGQSLADVPVARAEVSRYVDEVRAALPRDVVTPPSELSTRARVGNLASRGFGALGVAGGAWQTARGVNELRSGGDRVVGAADVGAGAAGIVSGAALMTGRVALGTGTGGAVAVIDGARDVYVGVRDGNAERAAVGTVKAGAGAAMIAGVATLNPVLVAGGAVAYGGAVVYESRDAIASVAKGAWGRLSSALSW